MLNPVDLPELPPFIAERLPYPRGAYRLQNGPDAGKRLHYLDTGGVSRKKGGRRRKSAPPEG